MLTSKAFFHFSTIKIQPAPLAMKELPLVSTRKWLLICKAVVPIRTVCIYIYTCMMFDCQIITLENAGIFLIIVMIILSENRTHQLKLKEVSLINKMLMIIVWYSIPPKTYLSGDHGMKGSDNACCRRISTLPQNRHIYSTLPLTCTSFKM